MNRIQFNLLGDFQYESSDGVDREIDLAKNVGLLSMLLLSRNYSCSRGKLIDLLWSDRCIDQGRASLRHALWSIKRALGEGADQLLIADRKKISLDPERFDVDVAAFESLRNSDHCQGLEQALGLYRGELLDGLSIRDRQWNEWLTLERENLHLKFMAALKKLCAIYLDRGAAQALIETGQRLIQCDPLCEDGHYFLMKAHALSSQRSLALRQFRRYERLAREELGSLPGTAITELRNSIVDDAEQQLVTSAEHGQAMESVPCSQIPDGLLGGVTFVYGNSNIHITVDDCNYSDIVPAWAR